MCILIKTRRKRETQKYCWHYENVKHFSVSIIILVRFQMFEKQGRDFELNNAQRRLEKLSLSILCNLASPLP